MQQADDFDLIQRALQGDLEAFNPLVLEYQTAAYNQALWILRDRAAAEDFTQEAFIQAFHSLNRFQGGSFRAWLLRIVANACLDELRRRKRRPSLSLTRTGDYGEEIESEAWLRDPGASVEEIVEQADRRASLQRAINQLPEDYRQAVLLVDVLEMDYAEAAEILGVPLGTVKSRLARARLQLRKRLEYALETPPDRVIEPA